MFGKTVFGKTVFGKTVFGKTVFGKTVPLKNQPGPLGPNKSEFVTAKLGDGTTLFQTRHVPLFDTWIVHLPLGSLTFHYFQHKLPY